MQDALLDQLCGLARIELTADERGDFKAKFEGLLAFVEQVQTYAARETGDPSAPPLVFVDQLVPRKDVAERFEWPAGTRHDYRVPQVIAFSEDEG